MAFLCSQWERERKKSRDDVTVPTVDPSIVVQRSDGVKKLAVWCRVLKVTTRMTSFSDPARSLSLKHGDIVRFSDSQTHATFAFSQEVPVSPQITDPTTNDLALCFRVEIIKDAMTPTKDWYRFQNFDGLFLCCSKKAGDGFLTRLEDAPNDGDQLFCIVPIYGTNDYSLRSRSQLSLQYSGVSENKTAGVDAIVEKTRYVFGQEEPVAGLKPEVAVTVTVMRSDERPINSLAATSMAMQPSMTTVSSVETNNNGNILWIVFGTLLGVVFLVLVGLFAFWIFRTETSTNQDYEKIGPDMPRDSDFAIIAGQTPSGPSPSPFSAQRPSGQTPRRIAGGMLQRDDERRRSSQTLVIHSDEGIV